MLAKMSSKGRMGIDARQAGRKRRGAAYQSREHAAAEKLDATLDEQSSFTMSGAVRSGRPAPHSAPAASRLRGLIASD
jgi:hypothetical protein